MIRTLALALAALLGYVAGVGGAHADAGTVDRALVERLVRAVESQARATERIAACRR